MSIEETLAEILERRGIEHERVLKNLECHGFEGAVEILCGWISIEQLKEMNDFWEASDPRCAGCNRPEAMCSADPCPDVIEDRKS